MQLTGQYYHAQHRGIEIKGAKSTDGFYFTCELYQGLEPGNYDEALKLFKQKIDEKIKRHERLNSQCKFHKCLHRCFNQYHSAYGGLNE